MLRYLARRLLWAVSVFVAVTLAGLLLAAATVTGAAFGLPGPGLIAIESISNFDLPVTQGVVVFGAIAIIVSNLVVDILYAWIDPRIRLT